MIPLLFSPTATTYTSGGQGSLSDCTKCITIERINERYDLEFEYPVRGRNAQKIVLKSQIFVNDEIFIVTDIKKRDMVMTVTAEQYAIHRLKYLPVMPCSKTGNPAAIMLEIKNNSVETCPLTFTVYGITDIYTFSISEPRSMLSCLYGKSGSVVDVVGGGEFTFNKTAVYFRQRRGSDKSITFSYGKNIVTMSHDQSGGDVITGVVPFWKKEENGTTTVVTINDPAVYNSNAGNFAFPLTVPLDCSEHFQIQPTKAQLKTYAQSYVNGSSVGLPKANLDVRIVDLSDTVEYTKKARWDLQLGDRVNIYIEPYDLDTTARIIEVQYDVLNDRISSVQVGSEKNSFVKSLVADMMKRRR